MAVNDISAIGASQSNSDGSLARLSKNLDNFLTILTTQLKHQDPLSPMDTHEFTNQLVMFSGVEQQVQTNANLESLITLQKNGVAMSAVSYVGKEITAAGKDFMQQGDSTTLRYHLPEAAKAATLTIYDPTGKMIRQVEAQKTAGLHEFVWDGKDSLGNTMPAGQYSFTVSAANASSQALDVAHGFKGIVTGVEFEDGFAVLRVGKVLVYLADLASVDNAPKAATPDNGDGGDGGDEDAHAGDPSDPDEING